MANLSQTLKDSLQQRKSESKAIVASARKELEQHGNFCHQQIKTLQKDAEKNINLLLQDHRKKVAMSWQIPMVVGSLLMVMGIMGGVWITLEYRKNKLVECEKLFREENKIYCKQKV